MELLPNHSESKQHSPALMAFCRPKLQIITDYYNYFKDFFKKPTAGKR